MNDQTHPQTESPASQRPARILVADDNPSNLKLLEDLLGFHGYEVEAVPGGDAALASVRARVPDLLLLDVLMPGLDGYEVCRAVRADSALAMLPVVMVTALEDREERVRGLEAGADDFLSKPINPPELLARVRSLLRIRRLYDTVQRQAAQLAAWNRTLEGRVAEEVAHVDKLQRLKRFFSPQLAELILAGGADDPLESHRREITVVFLDLRGFTAFAESAEPEEVMAALAEFHRAMGGRVLEYQGTLERFTGDGLMVFFNDPLPIQQPARRAVEMAFAMQEDALKLAAQWKRRGYDLGLGIGIAQGYATVGAIGFEGRIDYGAIGTVTNMANRLCDLAEPGNILVSQRVHTEVEGVALAEDLGDVGLHGFKRPVRAFRLLDLRGEGAGAVKLSSVRARIRQLCCLGLPSEMLVGSLLVALRELVPSESAAFFWVDARGEMKNLYAERLLPPEVMSLYFERYYDGGEGSFRKSFLERAAAPEGVLSTSPDRDLVKTGYYNEILRRLDAHHVLYGIVREQGAALGQVSLYRPQDAPAFGTRERGDLASVMRYVSHGIAVGDQAHASPELHLRDSEDEAMLVADRAGRVRHGSEKARRLLMLATTSEINPASLKAAVNDRAAQALRTLCTRLEAVQRGEDAAPPTMTLDTKWGRHVLRAYWLDDDPRASDALVGVRIQRQEPMILRFVEAMGRLPLSPQQREIALMIAQGRSNQEIAEGLGVSGNTVAYHIKQLFLKLDVHDRAGALERIVSGNAELRG